MANVFGPNEVQGITKGVNYNPDTGNYENGVHIPRNHPNHPQNLNPNIAMSLQTSTCYQCKYIAGTIDPEINNNCERSLACSDPSRNNPDSWFYKNCIIKCPEETPFCFSYKNFVGGNLIHVERGCYDLYEDETYIQSSSSRLESSDQEGRQEEDPDIPRGRPNYYTNNLFSRKYPQAWKPSKLDNEVCDNPEFTPTDAMTCEYICQDDFCNSEERVVAKKINYFGLLMLCLLVNLFLL